MGVHGLTTFISNYHEKYKEKIYLRECPVVIDGSNLMYHLYFDGPNSVVRRGPNSSKQSGSSKIPLAYMFGGDMEQYAQNVRHFFQQLKQCEITGIVIMDGAYHVEKMETAMHRFANSIKENIKMMAKGDQAYPGKSYTPIFLKTVFLEVLTEQKIFRCQTIGEADCTIAMVARRLGDCPILSSDSDFKIYINAVAVPLGSLKFAKAVQGKSCVNSVEKSGPSNQGSKVWTLQAEYVPLHKLCKEEFKLNDARLLPLAAIILGNDSLQSRTFKAFQASKAQGNPNSKSGRIACVLKWLARLQSVEDGITTLKAFVPSEERESTEFTMNSIVQMYEGCDGEFLVLEHLKKQPDINQWFKVYAVDCSALEFKGYNDEEKNERGKLYLEDEGNQEVVELMEDIRSFNYERLTIAQLSKRKLRTQRLQSKILETLLPGWYREKHLSCELQTYLLNIYKNRIIFLIPQAEKFDYESVHNLSIPLIKVTAGIVTGLDDDAVTLISRNKGRMHRQTFFPTTYLNKYGKLPTLYGEMLPTDPFYEDLSHEERFAILMEALELHDPQMMQHIMEWPSNLRIWIATLTSLLVRQCLPDYLGVQCMTTGLGVFFCIVKNLLTNPGSDAPSAKNNSITSYITPIFKKDAKNLKNMREFYKKFEDSSEVSSKKFLKTYEISLVHSLSEYHCLLYHTEMLNNLLANPMKSPKVRYILNNLFVYNLAFELKDIAVGDTGMAPELFEKIAVEIIGVPEIAAFIKKYFDVVIYLCLKQQKRDREK